MQKLWCSTKGSSLKMVLLCFDILQMFAGNNLIFFAWIFCRSSLQIVLLCYQVSWFQFKILATDFMTRANGFGLCQDKLKSFTDSKLPDFGIALLWSFAELQKPQKPTNLVWMKALAKHWRRYCVSVLRYPSAGKVGINWWIASLIKTMASLILKPGWSPNTCAKTDTRRKHLKYGGHDTSRALYY